MVEVTLKDQEFLRIGDWTVSVRRIGKKRVSLGIERLADAEEFHTEQAVPLDAQHQRV
jgi:hypothetical protein